MSLAPLQFLFVVVVPLVVVAGGLATLFAIGALFDALDNPEQLRPRLQAIFRHKPVPAAPPGKDHYYRPYWSSRA